MSGTLHRLADFTDIPSSGNPAGVWLGNVGLLQAPAQLIIRQGEAMGRPSRL